MEAVEDGSDDAPVVACAPRKQLWLADGGVSHGVHVAARFAEAYGVDVNTMLGNVLLNHTLHERALLFGGRQHLFLARVKPLCRHDFILTLNEQLIWAKAGQPSEGKGPSTLVKSGIQR